VSATRAAGPVERGGDPSDHLHNDDLLMGAAAQAAARAEFPAVFHVLHDPELLAAFRPVDERAMAHKRQSHRAGMIAVLFVVLALFGASSESLWHELPADVQAIIAIASALLGLAAVAVAAFGVMYGSRKAAWLHERLFTERLRQLHFQSFIWRLPEISASCAGHGAQAVETYVAQRRVWLAGFLARHRGHLDAMLTSLLDPNARADVWLHPVNPAQRPAVPHDLPQSVFEAYRACRLEAQLGYANYMLREGSGPLHGTGVRQQNHAINLVWTLAFGLLVLLHLGVAIGHGVHYLQHGGAGTDSWSMLESPWPHVLVVWLAVLALGARVMGDGLGLGRDIGRYEEYRATVQELLTRFQAAAGNDARLEVMIEMERTAFEEMRSFLRAHAEASFVF